MRKIFLSSTAKDLGDCCAELARALNALKGWHCVWMDDFYASDTTSVEYCQKSVQECDVYVGIIGPLYGSCPADSEISFTQHEYEAALTKGMPRLIFLTREDFPVPANLVEPDTKREAQQKFRKRLSQQRIVKFFNDSRDLKAWVIASLIDLSEEIVVTPPSLSRGPRAEPNFGLNVHRLCDRGPQEDAFISFFEEKIKQTPGIPHIYILCGEERENPDSLIDRFCTVTFERHLIRRLNLARESVIRRPVNWPDLESTLPMNTLLRNLLAECSEIDETYLELDAETFLTLKLLKSRGFLALKHTIREPRWTQKLRILVASYCRFWDEVAELRPVRQVLIFLSILYPNGTKEDGWKSLLPISLAFGSVERELIELQNRRQRETEKNPYMCPILRLPELCCVVDRHLMAWFDTNGFCKPDERERHRERLFSKRRCVHMAELERELEKIVTNCRNPTV